MQDAPTEPADESANERDRASRQRDEPKLRTQLRSACRRRGYALSTERTYWRWVVRYVRHRGRAAGGSGSELVHPRRLGAEDVRAFLSYLATDREVSTGTQGQALGRLSLPLRSGAGGRPWRDRRLRAWQSRPKRLPAVLTRSEVRAVLAEMSGAAKLAASLLYGSGLRLSEGLRLRVKDLGFERERLIVREGKGKKDRVTMLPPSLHDGLERQLRKVRAWHEEDLEAGVGEVYLPEALRRKYPNAGREWAWHWVFASRQLSADPRSGKRRRHHLSRSHIQRLFDN